ncbi:MAG: glycosyltransferase family 1 protein [Flavobacterium sp.]|nr:MAG: glycosyltransferase family 1 protein [Flavobacterium sp.]
MRTIFLTFTINNSSMTDYYLTLSQKLASEFCVVVVTDRIEPHFFTIDERIIITKWPSARPTHWRDFKFLMGLIKQYKPSVMISMFGSVNIFLLAGLFSGIPHRLVWYHTISTATNSTPLLHIRKKLIYRLASGFIANSKSTVVDLQQAFGIPKRKIMLSYNAVRDGKRLPVNQPPEIVYVGRLHKSKGIDVLLDAMPAVLAEFPEVRLHLYGGYLDGNAIKPYLNQVEQLQIGDNVKFFGNRPKEEIMEAFAKSYASVLPSFFEAFGYVVIESFSVGTPVIGSNTSGIAEIIRDGIDGMLFEPGNSAQLSQKIIHLLSDPKLREDFSVNCYQRFSADFEVGAVTAKVAEFIGSLDRKDPKNL